MIKIAICDNEEKELRITKEMCQAYFKIHSDWEYRISLFLKPQDLENRILNQEKFDIVLLDIYMNEISGMDLARTIRMKDDNCQIVFLTTSMVHAVEAFSVHAAHYLVKPYKLEQLIDALTIAITLTERYKKSYITLKVSGGAQRIEFDDILYSETDRHIQKIHLISEDYLCARITSTELYELLSDDPRFYKCGSTYIINFDKVEEVTKKYILFETGVRLPMQRRQYKNMLEQYTKYSLEGM